MNEDSLGNRSIKIEHVANSSIAINFNEEKKELPNRFNDILTRDLLKALKPLNLGVKKFMDVEIASQGEQEWNYQVKNKAKEWIIKSYDGGILNIHLQKLMSIGKDSAQDGKLKKYTERCLVTAKTALRILSIAMIAKLWAIKCKENVLIDQIQLDGLKQKFFETYFETEITGEFQLLQILYSIFKTHNLAFPIPEVATLENDFLTESKFGNDCSKLADIKKKLSDESCTLDTCSEVEVLLTAVLQKLVFLSSYKMASVKSIAYKQLPHETPDFIHYYSEIGRAKDSSLSVKKTVWTDAVLLYKDDYLENINLFPFVIDLNTIKSESGSKIYVYSCFNLGENEDSITYKFIDNEGDELTVPERNKEVGLLKVLEKFNEAKSRIVGDC